MAIKADFYDFLKNNECRAIKQGDFIEAWVHVDLFEVQEFHDIVKKCFGADTFSEHGVPAHLAYSSLCVDIGDIIDVEEYVNCFPDGIEEGQ